MVDDRSDTAKAAGRDFSWVVRVYYEDTDSAGVVYYANYLKFMERARSEWLRSLGFEQVDLARRDRLLFAVSRATMEFVSPARLEDVLTVGVTLQRLGRASLYFGQTVCRDDGTVLCRGQVRIACIDADSLRPRAIPSKLLSELKRGY